MTLRARCGGCARRLKAPEKFAGKRIKCPQCGAAVRIPLPSSGMTIPAPSSAPESGRRAPQPSAAIGLECDFCRTRFRVNARPELAGKRVECPECGDMVVVPTTELAAALASSPVAFGKVAHRRVTSSEPIKVQCGFCKRRIKYPGRLAGTRVRCPKCGDDIDLPAAATNVDEVPFVDDQPKRQPSEVPAVAAEGEELKFVDDGPKQEPSEISAAAAAAFSPPAEPHHERGTAEVSSPEMELECDFCRTRFGAPETLAGQDLECPECGETVSVPILLGDEPGLELVDEPLDGSVAAGPTGANTAPSFVPPAPLAEPAPPGALLGAFAGSLPDLSQEEEVLSAELIPDDPLLPEALLWSETAARASPLENVSRRTFGPGWKLALGIAAGVFFALLLLVGIVLAMFHAIRAMDSDDSHPPVAAEQVPAQASAALPTASPQMDKDLKSLGVFISAYADTHHDTKTPTSWESAKSFCRQSGRHADLKLLERLESEAVVVHWGVDFREARVGTSNYVIAYEKKTPQEGGLVLRLDGVTEPATPGMLMTFLMFQYDDLRMFGKAPPVPVDFGRGVKPTPPSSGRRPIDYKQPWPPRKGWYWPEEGR